MCQISIRIPDAVMYDTHMSEEEAAAFARCMVAVGYYCLLYTSPSPRDCS